MDPNQLAAILDALPAEENGYDLHWQLVEELHALAVFAHNNVTNEVLPTRAGECPDWLKQLRERHQRRYDDIRQLDGLPD